MQKLIAFRQIANTRTCSIFISPSVMLNLRPLRNYLFFNSARFSYIFQSFRSQAIRDCTKVQRIIVNLEECILMQYNTVNYQSQGVHRKGLRIKYTYVRHAKERLTCGVDRNLTSAFADSEKRVRIREYHPRQEATIHYRFYELPSAARYWYWSIV